MATASKITFSSTTQSSGQVKEDSILDLGGQIVPIDANAGATLTWSVLNAGVGTYGTLSIDQSGAWSYHLNNASPVVQALAAGEKVADTFSIVVTDQFGASAAKTVTIKVVGAEDRPVISGTASGVVREDIGLATGGQLVASDPDHGAHFTWSVGNGAGLYGTLAVDQNGKWAYALDNAKAQVQALNYGQKLKDTFTVYVDDGQGGSTAKRVVITIAGTNEATADFATTGENQPASVNVLANDPGAGLSLVSAGVPGGQGKVTVVGNQLIFDPGSAFDSLNAGETVNVSATYVARNGAGALSTSTATIMVVGENDAAAISGSSTGLISEDGVLSATGQLSVSDVDAGQAVFEVPSSLAGAYGTFSFDPLTGVWGYNLDNTSPGVQSLKAGDAVHDTLNVTSIDGTASKAIDVSIAGANDAPVANTPLPLDQAVTAGDLFSLTLAPDAFVDADAGDGLSLTAALADGSALPSWLSFDPATGTLSGTPGAADVGALQVDVTATDTAGASAAQGFTLSVNAPIAPLPNPFTAIDPAQSGSFADQIAGAILGNQPGIAIDPASLTMTAGPSSAMLYDGSLAQLGIGPGLLITSGTMPGTYNSAGYFGMDNNMPGIPALDAVVNTVFNTVSYDATSISFTFTVSDPAMTGIKFNAVFGSDEYPEWVDAFVDIGVVFVNGTNVAYFNNDPMSPLSVIGSNLASNYFIDNTGNLDTPSFGGVAVPGIPSKLPIEYDGVSNVLSVLAPVHQGLNTIEIAIADTGDHVYDSGLFISNLTATNVPVSGVARDVQGTSGDDDLVGTSLSEVFNGNGGNDVIHAAAGNDVLLGGGGSDTFYGDDGDDFLDAGEGTNGIFGGAGDDVIQHVKGVDHIDGGDGIDTLKLEHSAFLTGETLTFGQALGDGTTAVNVEVLEFHGGAGADFVAGGMANDVLDGGAGNDQLVGGGGNDSIVGGLGIDTAGYAGTLANYLVSDSGSGQFQILDLGSGSPDGTDTLSGIEYLKFADQTVSISQFENVGVTIIGTTKNDVINIATGATVAGQPLATNFGDTIKSGSGDDVVKAGNGNDKILGGGGDDRLWGNAGNDALTGGAGADEMWGGSGADTFAFLAVTDSTVAKFDQIGDFRPDEGDKIDLSHIDAISGTAANEAFTMVNAFISQAGQLFQTKVDGGWLLQGDINGDNTADFAIQVDSMVKLSNNDIWM